MTTKWLNWPNIAFALLFTLLSALCLYLIISPNEKLSIANDMRPFTEIGWRPIIGTVHNEPMSGIAYATISVNGDTNDIESYRPCIISPKIGIINASVDDIKEVYVISKAFKPNNYTLYLGGRKK